MNDLLNRRYEFRMFGPALAGLAETLATQLEESGVSAEADVYLLGIAGDSVNLKIRDGQIEKKTCVNLTEDGLQQWRPDSSAAFPLPPETLEEYFGVDAGEPVGFPELLDMIGRPNGGAQVMHLIKNRRHFERGVLTGEYCELMINGARVDSLAIESTNSALLAEFRELLGLSEAANTSYVQGLSQLAGLSPLPAESPWRADAGTVTGFGSTSGTVDQKDQETE